MSRAGGLKSLVPRARVAWAALMSVVGAAVGGAAEYWITGGASGVAPLIGAVIGAASTSVLLGVTGSPPDAQTLPEPQTPPEPRVFVYRTPDQLVADIDPHRTSLEQGRVAERYVGSWLEVTGPVRDVTPGWGAPHVLLRDETGPRVRLWFEEGSSQLGEVRLLDKGARIRAVGRIENVRPLSIRLTECEIVEHLPTPPQTAELRVAGGPRPQDRDDGAGDGVDDQDDGEGEH